MANRYWVGGNAIWNGVAGSKWATSSGGAGGASAPTPSDNAYFDGNSGAVTVSLDIDNNAECLNLICTGFTGTLGSGNYQIDCHGDITLAAGMTLGTVQFYPAGSACSITSAGKTIDFAGWHNNFTLTLLGDLTTPSIQSGENISINANGHNLTTGYVQLSSTDPHTLTLGTGTWTITQPDGWSVNATGTTIVPGTSTIKFTDTSSSHKLFAGAGKTYNNVWFVGGGTGQFQLTGSNTFNDFKFTSPPGTIKFTAGATTTVTTFTVSGTSGNLVTLDSLTASAHTLTKAGGGTIDCDYISVSNSTATPASTWYAGLNSTSVSNNTGWTFSTSTASPGSALFFGGGI